MKLIYISAPYSDPDPEVVKQNVAKAVEVAAWLNIHGQGKLFAVCPHIMGHEINAVMRRLGKPGDYDFWLEGFIERLRSCHGILFMAGWSGSKGCLDELYVAKEHDLLKEYLWDIRSDDIKDVAESFINRFEAKEQRSRPMKAEWRVMQTKRTKQHLWVRNHPDPYTWDYTLCGSMLGEIDLTLDPLPTDPRCKRCLKMAAKLWEQTNGN
jgi:hypothetical protein